MDSRSGALARHTSPPSDFAHHFKNKLFWDHRLQVFPQCTLVVWVVFTLTLAVRVYKSDSFVEIHTPEVT